MPFILRMSPLDSPRRWESRLIPLGVWRPPRPFLQVSQFRTSAMLRDGLRPWLLSGSMAWTCEPPQVLPSSRLRCAPLGYTRGRDWYVWCRGYLVPLASSTQLEFLSSRGHTSGIPTSACFFPEADAGFTARAFIPAGHYVTSPVTFRPSMGQITFGFRAGHAEGVPLASSTQRLVPSRNWGYIRNLRRFICGSHSIYLSICLIFVNLFAFICGS